MQIDDDIYEVTFHEIETDEKEYRVHAALLGFGLSSQVKRGENRGLQLQHDFVVVSYQNAILKKENNDFKGELKIVFPDKSGNSRKAIAFWVTTIKSPIPIQSTGGFIRDPV